MHSISRPAIAATAALGALLLGGCGGGAEAPALRPSLRALAAAQAGPAAPATQAAAGVTAITADQLFDWAQVQYPSLFPAGAATQSLRANGVSYTLRWYSGPNNYLAVGDVDGTVYALGNFTGNEIHDFGKLVDYTCTVAPGCTQPYGKNRYTTRVGGDVREYYVHVPTGYTGSAPTAVVFMLHGSGGDGDKFYNLSGWVGAGEAHNILTVYPSSWTYKCVVDDGENKNNASKWNAFGLVMCDATDHERDDVKFLGQVIDDLTTKFNVDTKRVYFVGFSSGGEMVSRASVDLGDRLAAVVANAGMLDKPYTPKRLALPITFQFGDSDPKIQARLGISQPLPMDIPALLTTYPMMQTTIDPFLTTFGITQAYRVTGIASQSLTANYSGLSGLPSNVFRMTIVKGLGHQYPNGVNHPMKGAEEHWAWMSQYASP